MDERGRRLRSSSPLGGTMIYYAAVLVALGATFYYALCKAAARADAAMVGWYRIAPTPDDELEDLVEAAIEDCEEVLGAEEIVRSQLEGRSIRARPKGLGASVGDVYRRGP